MGRLPATVDQLIARVASRSHGVVTYADLLRAGVSEKAIRVRVRRGSLIRVHRGVYRVGHRAPSMEATYLAAVRAGGPRALLSGFAAARLLGLIKRDPPPPPEIAAPARRDIGGVRAQIRRIAEADITQVRGIPVTSPARTLVDLAGEMAERDLARAVHEAAVRYRLKPERIEQILDRRPNAPGAGTLRAILRGDRRITLSKLERLFLARLREAGLELPATNTRVGRRYVDCRWPERHLTVELDGYRYHSSRHSWEQDRQREREAYERGDEFRRYTWDDVSERPRRMLDELRRVLP